jgi:4-amino-4-deoxy-L-arabinose transferase-like glycosyltransferase
VLAVAGVLNTRALSQNGYANIFYSAGVKSMIRSWHNFFYLSFDPSGLVTMDKPPLGLWIQAASAKLFGFSPLSLLLPQAIAGVLAVAALYLIVLRRFGVWAAVASAATLALFPAFVAVSRDNNLDTPLVLLMVLACGGALRACETGRLRTLLWSAVLLALAFNTKALAAYLVLPGIAVAYLVCAPGTVRRHLAHLVAAGLLLGVLSVAWMVAVDATPAGQRPFVGGSANNSELSLTFAYNGLGRVKGQLGGPGAAPNLFVAPRVSDAVPSHPQSAPGDHSAPSVTVAKPSPDVTPAIDHTIVDDPIAFGKAPGALRLFKNGMGDQGAWLLPLALIGLIAIALTRPSRRDPRLAGLIVLGGFFLVEAVLLSVSGGIVHPYYLSALGPGCAAMVGCGTRAMADLRRRAGVVLATLAVVVSVVVQILLLHHDHYLRAWVPGLIALSSLAVLVTILRQHRMMTGLTLALAALLVAPAAYCLTTWSRPVESTFPAAGPRAVGGYGGAGVSPEGLAANRQLIGYVLEHGPGTRFQLLTQASVTAATPILLGLKAAAMGGYGGIDPALDGPGLGRLLASGQARYVLIGGGYDYLGGNGASKAAERACPQVPTQLWSPLRWASTQDLYLLDCKGMAAELERQPS